MKTKLKRLLNNGWRIVGVFGRDFIILRRGSGEIVYNAATNQVVEKTPWVGDCDED